MKRVVVAVALLAGVTAAASSALAAQEASNADPGIGSAAALAAPSCDRERERLKFQSTGAPPCVKPWANGDDNGGATAQGVTKDSIAVVVLWADLPAARAAEGNIIDQATGEPGTEPDAIVDTNEVYEPFHETWGREIEYTFVKAGGLDEASQRADAVKVAAMKPFAVLDYATLYVGGGGLVFESALEGKVPVVFTFPCCAVIPAVERSNPLVANAGEWVGKALVGRKAKWAGDDTLQAEERVFGVVHPAGNFAIDLEVFTDELQRHGGKVKTAVSYPSGTEQLNSPPPEALEQAPTIISRLKSDGVTTVVNFASGLGMSPALTKAATDQDYFPEWVVTGNGYQDIDIVARQSDQQQLAHAFGLLWFNPYVDIQEGGAAAVSAFHWFWGTDKGTFSTGASSLVTSLYTGVHLAGPKLTATSFERALVERYPPTGGAFSDEITTLEQSWSEFGTMPPRGSALGWWSADTVGPSQIVGPSATGPGKWMFLDGGKRYIGGTFPKGEPKFFDASVSISVLDEIPPAERLPLYPCDDCPSAGGGPTASSNAAT